MTLKNIMIIMNNGKKISLGNVDINSEEDFINLLKSPEYNATFSIWNKKTNGKVAIFSESISHITYEIEETYDKNSENTNN